MYLLSFSKTQWSTINQTIFLLDNRLHLNLNEPYSEHFSEPYSEPYSSALKRK